MSHIEFGKPSKNVETFLRERDRLIQEHPGMYVAIVDGEIKSIEEQFSTLVKHMRNSFPDQVIFIEQLIFAGENLDAFDEGQAGELILDKANILAYEGISAETWAKHVEEWVAIVDGEVIGFNTDFQATIEMARKVHPDRDIFIDKQKAKLL